MKQLIKNLNFIWNKFKKTNTEFWSEVEEQLILNDVSAQTADYIISDVREKAIKDNVSDLDSVRQMLKDKISSILKDSSPDNADKDKIEKKSKDAPEIWMFVGINGVGKTSTVAKLANYFKNLGKSVLLTAADTFRSAAFEQIDYYAKLLELPIVHHQRYSDPGAVVYDSLEKAAAKKIDIVLIDTAGRMHTAYNLMEELKKIKKIINKKTGREPDEILMVIDSTTGQNARNQVSIFNEALDLTGLILTKTDGTSKGGIVITIRNELKLPVKFITTGEKIENLEIFDADKFSNILLS